MSKLRRSFPFVVLQRRFHDNARVQPLLCSLNLSLDEVLVDVASWFAVTFSNSFIIHAALAQPEHLIQVRWMSLETQ